MPDDHRTMTASAASTISQQPITGGTGKADWWEEKGEPIDPSTVAPGALKVEILVAGDGFRYPRPGMVVAVDYVGYLPDGKTPSGPRVCHQAVASCVRRTGRVLRSPQRPSPSPTPSFLSLHHTLVPDAKRAARLALSSQAPTAAPRLSPPRLDSRRARHSV